MMDLSRLQTALVTALAATCDGGQERMKETDDMLYSFWDLDFAEMDAIRCIDKLNVESQSVLCDVMHITVDDLAVFRRVLRALTN